MTKITDVNSEITQVAIRRDDALTSISPSQMAEQIKNEQEKRKLLTQYIAKNLKKGTDYGPIHIKKDCENKYNCTNKYHYSKDVLFKPGAEKFCSLFKLRAEFLEDAETKTMLGNKDGIIAFICRLYTPNGILAGEGRGVCSVAEKNGSENVAVKIAEKRAKIDAVLGTGGLSDFFTADLEEIELDKDQTPILDLNQDESVKQAKQQDRKTATELNKQKMMILQYLEELKMPTLSKKDCENSVLELTEEKLEITNYRSIIDKLSILREEKGINK